MSRAGLAVLALLLCGCGGQLGSASEEETRIAFVPKSLNQEFWINTQKGAEEAGRKLGVKVVTQAPLADTDVQRQIDIVENMLAQGVDAIVIAPNDSDLLKPVLTRAAKEIPVVLFDTDIPGWKPSTAYVGTQNVEGGRIAGKYVAEQTKGEKATLAIVSGIPGSQVGIERVKGLEEGLKGSKVEVVKDVAGNFDREQSVGATEDILQTNEDVDFIFTANDQEALGALQAIDARDLTGKTRLVGFDGAIEAAQQIIAGSMDATVAQAPFDMGSIAVETAVRKGKGEEVKKKVDTGAELVTKRNAEKYLRSVEDKQGR